MPDLPVVFSEKKYIIFKSHDGYIVMNKDMEGFAHTHIENERTARWIVSLSNTKKLPRDMKRYLLISLLRVNDDETYCRKIGELIENKRKKQTYINRSCA